MIAANWIEQLISTGGVGNLVLGASSNNGVTFAQAFGADRTDVLYAIKSSASGNYIECGLCDYTHSTSTLSNRRPEATFDGATYDDSSPSAVNVPVDAIITTPLTWANYETIASKLVGVTAVDWDLAAADLGTISTNQSLDLDTQHDFTATLGADIEIDFTSGRGHTHTQWTFTLNVGTLTPTWKYNGALINLADGYDISGSPSWVEFSFKRTPTGVSVSERKIT